MNPNSTEIMIQFPIRPIKRKFSRNHFWSNPFGFCFWCGTKLISRQELPKGKKRYYSKYFCVWDKKNKQDCSYQYNIHFVWSNLRDHILDRDNYTCQKSTRHLCIEGNLWECDICGIQIKEEVEL